MKVKANESEHFLVSMETCLQMINIYDIIGMMLVSKTCNQYKTININWYNKNMTKFHRNIIKYCNKIFQQQVCTLEMQHSVCSFHVVYPES